MEFFHALRGTKCKIEPPDLVTVDSVRQSLSASQGIEVNNLFLLISPSGHQLKPEHLAKGQQRAFVYDKAWIIEHSNSSLLPQIPLLPPDPYLSPMYTDPSMEIVAEAERTVVAHLKHNMSIVNKQLQKLQPVQRKLEADLAICDGWQRSWHALLQLPQFGDKLPQLLEKAQIEKDYNQMTEIMSDAAQKCQQLVSKWDSIAKKAPQFDTLKEFATIEDAQHSMLKTMADASAVQHSISSELKKPISRINESFRRVDALKSSVAQIIDLPFVYGVLKIESCRRAKWLSDFQPLKQSELRRRQQWEKHYCEGAVGELMEKVENVTDTKLDASVDAHLDPPAAKSSDPFKDVEEYIHQLDSFGLYDICRDLKKELENVHRQTQRSMTASISSLSLVNGINGSINGTSNGTGTNGVNSNGTGTNGISNGVSNGFNNINNGNDITNSTIAAYEARIRKFEIMLMQARMTNNTNELDLVRAETRAEARAEAKAEFRAEQQQQRITELEQMNAQLMDRVQQDSKGWELVLNSMGLQTTRINPESGESGDYQVSRVKGLGRKTNAMAASFMEASQVQSESSGNAPSGNSNATAAGSQPHTRNSVGNSESSAHLNYEKLLEKTYIDHNVLFDAVSKRFGDVERLARKLQSENRQLFERIAKLERETRQRVALRSFKANDLILFLPTRDSHRQPNIWAAFNARAPHYFLHPKHAKQLINHEYLLARASKIEKQVVDGTAENPFGLPHGVEWYLITIDGEWAV